MQMQRLSFRSASSFTWVELLAASGHACVPLGKSLRTEIPTVTNTNRTCFRALCLPQDALLGY